MLSVCYVACQRVLQLVFLLIRSPEFKELEIVIRLGPSTEALGEELANALASRRMAIRACFVSFADARGIRHGVEVEAESLFEAVVLAVKRLNHEVWIEKIGPATILDVEVREPSTRHSISLQQVERWLSGATTTPNEAAKKTKLKMLLMRG